MRICDALASGEAWAGKALYERVSGIVNSVLYRILRHGDSEWEDIAQQALERIISTVTSQRFARECNLRTWSAVITQYTALDALRRRKRERSVFLPEEEDMDAQTLVCPKDTPEMAFAARRTFEMFLTALKSVPKVKAEAFMLHDVLGFDLVAMAQFTGVSVAAAQSRLVRGRVELLKFVHAQERGDR